MDNVQEAKRLLALTRKEHLKDIRQLELDKAVDFFEKAVRQHARPTEARPSTTWSRRRSARSKTTAATSSRTWTICAAATS
jgi:hypothetical protein